MSAIPTTQYTKSGDVHIAYQIVGEGDQDLVLVPGFVSNLEQTWAHPLPTQFHTRLASFGRLILFDKRGTGLSDRDVPIPTLEQRMDDVRAVMDAVGSRRATLVGISEGGAMSILFAATYPERTAALVLYGAYARRAWAPDHSIGRTWEAMNAVFNDMERNWNDPGAVLSMWAPSATRDPAQADWYRQYLRSSASPGAAIKILRMNMEIDVRPVLSAIRVPTLVLHRSGDRVTSIEQGRLLADRIPGARFVELPGEDHSPYSGDVERLADEIGAFVLGVGDGLESNRILATVLFTDIVKSTERAAALGDRRWGELLETHHRLVRRELSRFRGREVDTAGDGFLATFDGPARGIRCARRIVDVVQELGLDVRAGLHVGECEIIAGKPGGITVHIGSRVAGAAASGEVLVSQTVKDLVAGSGIAFESRGTHRLKGLDGEWPLYAVSGESRLA